jgi:dCTP deaminase
VADEFKIFTNINNTSSIQELRSASFVDVKTDCLHRPAELVRARAHRSSTFRIPRDVLTICLGKSTYARCGIIVNVTPFETRMGGDGDARDLEHDPLAGENLRQRGDRAVLFFQSDEPCEMSYQTKGQVSGAARRDAAENLTYIPVHSI